MKWEFPKKSWAKIAAFAFFQIWLFLAGKQVHALMLPLPPSFAFDVLSESVPTALSINDFEGEDFSVQWLGAPLGETVLSIERNSFEWVRVGEVLVLPRARLLVKAEGVEGGRVSQESFNQALVVVNKQGRAELPIALISGEKNPIEIVLKRGGKEVRGKAVVRFKPRKKADGAFIYFDPSCSRYGVTAKTVGYDVAESANHPDWMYVGCRMVQVEGARYRTSSLELLVFWDNVGQQIDVGGVQTPSSSVSVWALRQRSEPASVTLKNQNHEITLSYFIPKDFYRGSVGLGLGPYSFTFRNATTEVNSWVLMPTFYLSYFISETVRIVAFDATTINNLAVTDFGVYLSTEYIRTLDRRIVVNLMLGIHFNGFNNNGRNNFIMGAPQGVEVIFTDFMSKAKNLTVGGFVYPSIAGKSYYNTWLRWGSGRLFGEVNYIAWSEKIDGEPFESRSMGVSMGFPIPFLRFL